MGIQANETTPPTELSAEAALERLRTIVDEKIGIQPLLGWEELLSLVEKRLWSDWRRKWSLSEALNDCYQATLPEGTLRASEIVAICAHRDVSNALSSPQDCGREPSPDGVSS